MGSIHLRQGGILSGCSAGRLRRRPPKGLAAAARGRGRLRRRLPTLDEVGQSGRRPLFPQDARKRKRRTRTVLCRGRICRPWLTATGASQDLKFLPPSLERRVFHPPCEILTRKEVRGRSRQPPAHHFCESRGQVRRQERYMGAADRAATLGIRPTGRGRPVPVHLRGRKGRCRRGRPPPQHRDTPGVRPGRR